jgi:hypothetical protein
MHHFSVRRSAVVLTGFSLVTLAAACEDRRVKQLDTGITRDSVVSVISHEVKGTKPDSFPNVYTRESFLVNGKRIEILYFTPNNEKQGKDSVAWRKLTPLVLVENKLIGRGWGFWDSVAGANHIMKHER